MYKTIWENYIKTLFPIAIHIRLPNMGICHYQVMWAIMPCYKPVEHVGICVGKQ